ncbi:hypothetical protein EB001_26050, partial [bacterium]|nr:hypothetical protein [bacterium]
MEVMRTPPYPIVTKWDVPSPNTDYSIYIEDLVDHSFENVPVTSDSNSQITYTIPRSKAQFDRIFLFRVTDEEDEIVIDSNLDILRPYIDYRMLATTASEEVEYKMYELTARSIIDSIINDGFYNNKHIIQTVGLGTDYFPIWEDVNRVLKVYENNVLVYDVDTPETNEYTYVITLDNSAIQRVETDKVNRSESIPLIIPRGGGDIAAYGGKGVVFPKGFDYTFIVDSGYKAVPPQIELATKLLIEDIKCGKMDYFKRYVTAYNTDQFRIQFDK